MQTVAANTSSTITLARGDRLAFDAGGQGTVTIKDAAGTTFAVQQINGQPISVGPFEDVARVVVGAITAVTYNTQTPDLTEYNNAGDVVVRQDPATGALVGAGGEDVLRTNQPPGADVLAPEPEHQVITAAISSTVTTRITPAAVFRVARLVWVNSGGSGSGVLNIALNCKNDVEGIVACQSAKQRELTLAMGADVQIVSPVPITSINIASDTTYTADTHRLLVSFGE